MNVPLAHVSATFAPLEVMPLLLAAALYAKRSITLADRGRPLPLWRQLCFAGGLLMIAVALVSPVAHIGEELVIAHMVEHLILGDLATLLLVLGLTGPLLQPILAIRIFDRLRILAHPLVAFPLWALNFYFWHIPALYDAAYGGAIVHVVEHTSFIFFGCLMWMPIFGPLPKPSWFNAAWKLGYVVAVRFAGAILGNVLMWSGTVLYPKYAAGEAYWGISPLADQSTAGVVMLDLATERGVELDEARAQRAVAAGQAERLERQLIGAGGEGEHE
jgi:putative membrane protein